jgi:hypothetical protein
MGVDMNAVKAGDENNQHALGAGKVDMNHVIDILQRYEYWDAAELLKNTLEG